MTTTRIGGWTLVAAAGATILGMAHHPVGLQTGLGQIVHGAMIVIIVAMAFGFATFVADRGAGRATMLAGAIAYALAAFAGIGAGLINGFIAPAMAVTAEPVGNDIFELAWAANQTLAWTGVIATGAAYLLWSGDFLWRPHLYSKAVGLLGIAAALVPAGLLFAGVLRMNVTGAFIVYAMQAAWAALVGLHLLAETTPRQQPAEE